MILPILAYGWSALRKPCTDVPADFRNLNTLVRDMWETMYQANGCGLAAPQVGHHINLFMVDSKATYENLDPESRQRLFDAGDSGIVETFVNARIMWHSDEVWTDEEGCLSIPGLVRPVARSWSITIEYMDQHLEKQIRTFGGLTARMIQHEFDHTCGILHIDHLTAFQRTLLENKLKKIQRGRIRPAYSMKFISDNP